MEESQESRESLESQEPQESQESQESQELPCSLVCLDTASLSRDQDDDQDDSPPHKVAKVSNLDESSPSVSQGLHEEDQGLLYSQSQYESRQPSSLTESQFAERLREQAGTGGTSSSSQTADTSSPAGKSSPVGQPSSAGKSSKTRKKNATTNRATKRKARSSPQRKEKEKETEKENEPGHRTWEINGCASEFNLRSKTEFREQTIYQHGRSHIRAVVQKLNTLGIRAGTGILPIFQKLVDSTLDDLARYTSNQARKKGDRQIHLWEIYTWLAMEIYFGFLNVPRVDAVRHWGYIVTGLGLNAAECVLSDDDFKLVQRHLCPYDPEIVNPTVGATTLAEPWVDRAFVKSCGVVMTRYGQYSLDDEQMGSKGKDVPGETTNKGKSRQQGQCSDQLVDPILKVVVSVRYRKRGYGQHEAAVSMIDAWASLAQRSIQTLTGNTWTFDRGYCTAKLWKKLAKLGIGFTGICTPDSVDAGHPFVGKTSSKAKEYNEAGRIPDEERMGDGIFTATKRYAHVDGSTTDVYAYALRQANRKADAPSAEVTQVIRMISSRTPVSGAELSNTVVWEPKPSVAPLIEARSLFFNSGQVCPRATMRNRNFIEGKLSDRGVVPLTMDQRCADWFVLRRFILTGTTAAGLATRGPSACTLVTKQKGKQLTNEETFARMCKSWFCRYRRPSENMRQGTMNETPVMNTLRKQQYIQQLFGIGLIYNETCKWIGASCDGIAVFHCLPATSSSDKRRMSWSDPNESDSDGSYDDSREDVDEDINENVEGGPDGSPPPGIDSLLTNSDDDASSDDDDSGPDDDDCGPDVEQDEAGLDIEPGTLAAVEIKTLTTHARVRKASDIARQHGTFFPCDVGSEMWWSVVPTSSHRGQLLHQAMVTRLEHVLYVVARVGGRILYVVDVRITPEQVEDYRRSLRQYAHLLEWRFSPQLPLPFDATSTWGRVALSHSPLWLTVSKHVNEHGPMVPVLKFKSAIQDMYNALKHGIDGMSQLLLPSYNSARKYRFRQKLVVHTLRQVALNACSIQWLVTACQRPWEGMGKFRRLRNRYRSNGTMIRLAEALCREGARLRAAHNAQHAQVDPTLATVPQRNRLTWFYENSDGRRLRLDGRDHIVVRGPSRRCVICRRKVKTSCRKCHAPLCLVNGRNHFLEFHSDTIPNTE